MDAPFSNYTTRVRPEWIDASNHMNLAYYLLVFEEAAKPFFAAVGLGQDYRARSAHALFAAETHITFDREVREGDPLRVESRVLDATDKALDCMHMMYHGEEGYLAATNQVLYLHVDLAERCVVPFGGEVRARVEAWRQAHASLSRPAQVGRAITLRKGAKMEACR